MNIRVAIAGALFCLVSLTSALALGPGDLLFTGFNADVDDDFAIVCLVDVPANTIVFFTDNEWNGTAFVGGEGVIEWDSGGASISAGTVVNFTNVSDNGTMGVSVGSITEPDGGFNPNGDNEAIWAYQGAAHDSPPTGFVAMLSNEEPIDPTGGGTLTGSGLTLGVSALEIDGDEDICAYNGTRTGPNAAGYRALICNAANWITQDGSGDQSGDSTAPDVPFDTTAFTIADVDSGTNFNLR